MGVLADSGLIVQAQPAIADLGVEDWVTEGASWRWVVDDVVDASGDAFDYSLLSDTICHVLTAPGGDVVVELVCTWSTYTVPVSFVATRDVSRLTVALPAAATVGLAAGRSQRECRWFLRLEDAVDELYFWRAQESYLHIGIGD